MLNTFTITIEVVPPAGTHSVYTEIVGEIAYKWFQRGNESGSETPDERVSLMFPDSATHRTNSDLTLHNSRSQPFESSRTPLGCANARN